MTATRPVCMLCLAAGVLWAAPRPGDATDVLGGVRAATRGAAPTLVRAPYLQKVGADSATILWATREPGAAEVRYRAQSGGLTRTAAANSTRFSSNLTAMAGDYFQHEATLSGLAAATTYQYDVYVDGVDATPLSDALTTAPPVGAGDISFVVFGDSGSGDANQRLMADLMAAEFRAGRWDLAVHTGDIVYPKGTYQLFHDRFFAIYEEWLRRRPIFFGVGNHEYYVNDAQPYLDLFAMPENGHDPQFPGYRERYFSFDYGPVHFVALDTNAFLGNASRQQQLTWLARDLESTSQPWRIVFMHIPAYGSSDLSSTLSLRSALQPLFERYGVQLLLAGHEHDYARGAPWAEAPAGFAPVMHVVSGGGGASLNDPIPGPWLVNWRSAFHFLSVAVSDCAPGSSCALTLEAIGRDGQVFDTFTLPRRAQQQDREAPEVSWISPPPAAVVSGDTVIAAAASDDQQVVKVDVWVDGALRLVDGTPPYEWTWDTQDELNGQRSLVLKAHDVAGRITESAPRVVRVSNPRPSIRLLSPSWGERVLTGSAYRIRWDAAEGAGPMASFRVEIAPNGKVFEPLAGCTSLPAAARECLWKTPAPLTKRAAVRVTVTDTAGVAVVSAAPTFQVQSGTPTLRVRFPDKAVALGSGSSQALSWSSNMTDSELNVELSRDGGATWEVVMPSLFPLNGDPRWIVSGPPTTDGLIRISSPNTLVHDVSNARFSIAPVSLATTSPASGTTWRTNTQVTVKWTSNLGAYDRVNVRLSTDGGATYPTLLAASVAANATAGARVMVPAPATTTARILIESLVNPAWRAESPVFRIVP